MASLNPNDRAPLCLFSFEDGRRCRTPRTGNHPHFCFYHAQKEARAQATEKISKDLAYFLAGDYLSANDLSAALARLIPAVLRGDIKPRAARTVAFMLQTLSQTIRLAQHEYVTTFGANNWRQAVADGVAANSQYRSPALQPRTGQRSGQRAEQPAGQPGDRLQPGTPSSASQARQPQTSPVPVGTQHTARQTPQPRPVVPAYQTPGPTPSSPSAATGTPPPAASTPNSFNLNS